MVRAAALLLVLLVAGSGHDPGAPDTVDIPGGSFVMGAERANHDEAPPHDVTLSAYRMDRTLVTVGAFCEHVRATERFDAVEGPYWRTSVDCAIEFLQYDDYRDIDADGLTFEARRKAATSALHHGLSAAGIPVEGRTLDELAADPAVQALATAQAALPAREVTWRDAAAYCATRGARLPTEAEFEYALRAGNAGVVYPWGDAHLPPPGHGNYAGESAPRDRAEGHPLTGYDDGFGLTAPVASFPANAFGVHDLSGNIWEWCSDWFDHDFYSVSPPQDPHGAPAGQRRVLKGGNFYCIREELRVSERHHKRPDDTAVYSGFRCAADAPE